MCRVLIPSPDTQNTLQQTMVENTVLSKLALGSVHTGYGSKKLWLHWMRSCRVLIPSPDAQNTLKQTMVENTVLVVLVLTVFVIPKTVFAASKW